MRIIPKILRHDLALAAEGIGSKNNKEQCKCVKCKALRARRDKIYNSIRHKFNRWCNLNF